MEISFDEIKRSPFEEIGSQYQFLGNISSGSFGLVVKALDINTKEEVSIKIINKLSHKIDIFRIKEEINILKRLKHPNILKFYDYIETNSKVYIIMELLKGGTLREWIKKHKNENISEEKSSLIIKNILLAQFRPAGFIEGGRCCQFTGNERPLPKPASQQGEKHWIHRPKSRRLRRSLCFSSRMPVIIS